MGNSAEIDGGFISRVHSVISEALEINETDINEKLNVDNTAAWDSLAHLKLVLSLEEEFNITIEEKNIGTMLDYLGILNTVRHALNSKHKEVDDG